MEKKQNRIRSLLEEEARKAEERLDRIFASFSKKEKEEFLTKITKKK